MFMVSMIKGKQYGVKQQSPTRMNTRIGDQ